MQRLAPLPHLAVHDLGRVQSGLVTFTVNGRLAMAVQHYLHRQQINVSVSRIGSTRLDMEASGLTELVRASLHNYNSEAEIGRFCDLLAAWAGDHNTL